MRHKVTKNMDKKTLFIVLITGLIITSLGVFFNKILTGVLADLVLPDTLKKYYSTYTIESNGVNIPFRMEYLTNNGKLFAFCSSLSSIFVAIIIYIIINVFATKFYEKCDKGTVKSITKILGLIVLFLGIFTFTSKVNPNNNIEKYIIKLEPSSYSQRSDSFDGDKDNIIGYFKPLDLDEKNNLVAVYESPVLESAPVLEKDCVGRFFVYSIRNIDKINNYSEIITIILGIYIFVLNKFQKVHQQ
ncbi:hypothetical protein R0V13_09440 [Facklamia hominis]|uniref:hypothetical protein n=1 Tax=Facklamia hominis TaxID=178214 RepID=UPI0029D41BF9|nr:hypothetical protein [Facklamia hominis]WPJ90679.1 hypothetical protein R0V13_09440 [Facklamia hominis]